MSLVTHLEWLKDPAKRRRQKGLLAVLAHLPSAEVEAAVHDRLRSDPDPEVQQMAAKVLGLIPDLATSANKIEPMDATLRETFEKMLDDPSRRKRMKALSKVLKHRDRRLLPLIRESLDKQADASVRSAIVSLVSQLGDHRDLPVLLGALDDESPKVIAAAATGVGRIAQDVALPLLRPLMMHPDGRVVSAAMVAFKPYDPHEVEERLKGLLTSGEEAKRALALHLVELFDDPAYGQMVRSLVQDEPIPYLKEQGQAYLDEIDQSIDISRALILRTRLADPSADNRLKALADVRDLIGDPEVALLLSATAQLDPDARVREAAAALVAQMPAGDEGSESELRDLSRRVTDIPSIDRTVAEEERVDKMLRQLLGKRQPRLRAKAVLKVRKYKYVKLLPELSKQLEVETTPVVIAAMIATIGELGGEEHISLIATYLAHINYKVVGAAVIALHQLGGDSLQELFLPLLTREDKRIVSLALIALLRFDREIVYEYIKTMTRTNRDPVRKAAIFLLERLPQEAAEDILIEWVGRETSHELAREAVHVLCQLVSMKAVGRLWALKASNPFCKDHVTSVLKVLAERTGTPLADLERQGQDYLDAHPEMGRARGAESKDYQEKLIAQMKRKEDEAEAARTLRRYWQHPSVIVAGVVGLVALGIGLDWGRSLPDLGPGILPAGGDPIRRLQDLAEKNQAPTERPAFKPLSEFAGSSWAEKVEGYAQQFVPRPAPITLEQSVEHMKALIREQGYTQGEYIEITAQYESRMVELGGLLEIQQMLDEGQLEGLEEKLKGLLEECTEKDLVLKRELNFALVQLYLRQGRVDEAKAAAKEEHRLAGTMMEIYGKTEKPGGGMLASAQELAEHKALGDRVGEGFEDVAKAYAEGASPTRASPAAIDEARSLVEGSRSKGEMDEATYKKTMERLDQVARGEDLDVDPASRPAEEKEESGGE